MIGLELAHVALSTVASMIMIGLGFLARPSRATALWSLTFVLAMVSSYGQLAGVSMDNETLRVASLGAILGAPVLIWSGLRAFRGAVAVPWATILVAGGAATAFALASDTTAFAWTFRLAYTVTAVFAGLTLWELIRRPERGGGTSFPLSLFSAAFVAMAALSLITGIFAPTAEASGLGLLRDVNLLGMLIYITCALITLLFLARGTAGGRTAASASQFETVAADRLERAQAAGERSWALLVVTLDDSADLRLAAGEAGYAGIASRFVREVREAMPTDADVGRLDASTCAILIARPAAVLSEQISTLLHDITTPGGAGTEAIPVSASVGWAAPAEHGYRLDDTLAAARAAAVAAAVAGGDRWVRAGLA
ncbi:hypothetical protein [Microbacterium telephonicum]|uniref:GGDEF domain-containing protein n=1 Tax=Microbacterium telephonicum TaxID=1714841 RepID=A0A498C6S3_9MICO|nr:hypothetical protein [Microbacterium telephonicum]RLK48001.1 hypothetical protein C7474_2603 [Microbacterium telephonicum]